MSDFDPYHKWLGISPQHQPPNHYRLLSLDLYESDPDVIEAAVDRIAAFLQDVAAGPQAKESQQLLNEIATARLCLLDESQKSEYDQKLKAELAPASHTPEAPPAPAVPPPASTTFAIDTGSDSTGELSVARKPAAKRPAATTANQPKQAKKRTSPLLMLSFVSGGVLLIAAIAFAIFGGDSEAKRRASEDARRRERQESFAEMGRQAESMIPEFEANFEAIPPTETQPKNRAQQRRNRNKNRNKN